MMSMTEVKDASDSELEALVREKRGQVEELRVEIKAICLERERRSNMQRLDKRVKQLRSEFDAQTLAAAGIPSEESVNSAGV